MKNTLLDVCERKIFYLFIFLIPFQVGKFIVSFGSLDNFFYDKFFIYLSDVLIVALICCWLIRIFRNRQKDIFYSNVKKEFFLVSFFLVSGISIMVAGNKIVAVMHFIKLSELLLLYFYLKNNFHRFDRRYFSYALLSSALLQVLIVGLQFYIQESIGIRHLGESIISPVIDNVAKINEDGYKLIRAYGTFPHPNVLAAFLSLALFLPYYLYLDNRAGMRQKSAIAPLPHCSKMRQMSDRIFIVMTGMTSSVKSLVGIVLFFCLMAGLFMASSRIVIASFISTSLTMFFLSFVFRNRMNIDPRKIYGSMLSLIVFLIILVFIFNEELFSRLGEISSMNQRIFYVDIFKDVLAHFPILGVGIGNFMDYFYSNFSGLPEWQYQPIHNLFLLMVAEIGLIGGLLFISFLGYNIYRTIKKDVHDLFKWVILFAVINFLIIANFDHYFWTLQQGQILFWMTVGILGSWNLPSNKNDNLSSNQLPS